MPAIHLARLKIQTVRLGESFSEPEIFVRSLKKLLDYYSDRTHRPGQAGSPFPLLSAYKAPLPVLRQILIEVTPRARENAAGALKLCDTLWPEENFECRLLAAWLLGAISPTQPGPILERALKWGRQETEFRLVDAILNQGLARLRQEANPSFQSALQTWIRSEEVRDQQLALGALPPLLSDPWFENLPYVFKLLTSYVRQVHPRLRSDLVVVLTALARRFPQETAFFLRANLNTPDNPDTPWLIRQVLHEFRGELQEGLRQALRQAG